MNEEESNFTSLFIESVEDFIHQQNLLDQAKIAATVTIMEKGDFHILHIKTLKSPIKELIIKQYRILFFLNKNIIYFIGAFVKKTAKTPKKQIDQAEKIYKLILKK